MSILLRQLSILSSNNLPETTFGQFHRTKSRKLLESCTNSEQCTIFNDEEVCRKCTTPWSDINYSMNIQPVKMKKCRAAKMLQTQANQQQMVKRMSRDANNVMVKLLKLVSTLTRFTHESILCHLSSRSRNVVYARIVRESFYGRNHRKIYRSYRRNSHRNQRSNRSLFSILFPMNATRIRRRKSENTRKIKQPAYCTQ